MTALSDATGAALISAKPLNLASWADTPESVKNWRDHGGRYLVTYMDGTSAFAWGCEITVPRNSIPVAQADTQLRTHPFDSAVVLELLDADTQSALAATASPAGAGLRETGARTPAASVSA